MSMLIHPEVIGVQDKRKTKKQLIDELVELRLRNGELEKATTRYKEAETALRKSEQRFKEITENIREIFWVRDQESGKIIYVSPTYGDLWQLPVEELYGETPGWMALMHPDDRKIAVANIEKQAQGLSTQEEFRITLPDGSIRWIESRAYPIKDSDTGEVYRVTGVALDVTERKRMEQALLRSQRELSIRDRLASIFLANPGEEMYTEVLDAVLEIMESECGIFGYIDEDGSLVRSSMTGDIWEQCQMADKDIVFPREAWRGIWGKSLIEKLPLYSNAPFQVPAGHVPISRVLVVPIIYQEEVIGELQVANKATDYDEADKALLETIAGYVAPILHTRLQRDIEEKRRSQAEEELKEHREHLETLVQERTEELKREITEREYIEAELAKTQKLEAIGVLAGGIAHNFNNILTAILGNISLAELYLKSGRSSSEVLDKLTESEKACTRAKALTHRLITFSSGGAPITREAAIAELLRRSVDSAFQGPNIRCEVLISDDLGIVKIDEGQIDQVMNNLIINANQAMPDGGVIKIRAENVTVRVQDGLALPDGEYVKISIEDQGTGISEKNINRIFDPFFTTKNASGLGLAICHSIIRKHNGLITLESQVGSGATFYVYLPVHQIDVPVMEEVEEEPDSQKIRILVMDDKQIIRDFLAEVLDNIGYKVTTVTDGVQAIKVYRDAMESGRPFDAIIMDLTVPGGMGGMETIRRLMMMDPEVKAIVSSGYSNDPIMTDFKKYGFKGGILKPYTIEALTDMLQKLLSEDAP